MRTRSERRRCSFYEDAGKDQLERAGDREDDGEIRCDAANFNKFLGAIRGLVLDGGTSPPIEVNHMRGGSQIESPASH